jgi:hypothetical protein
MSVSDKPLLSPSAQALTGRLSEHTSLKNRFAQHSGLTVIAADPWSGTSALLGVLEQDDPRIVLVDARRAQDTLDLATVIADAAIAKLSPDFHNAWLSADLHDSPSGRALFRRVGVRDIDLDELHRGSGPPLARLRDAFAVVAADAPDGAIIVIDHFGAMLAAQSAKERRELTAELRSIRQAQPTLDFVFVEHTGVEPLSGALRDPGHPLYQSGQRVRIRRADPRELAGDLVVTRGWTSVDADLLRASAELAAGVPALTWRVVELAAGASSDDPQQQALAGWRKLQHLTEPANAHQWDLLRRLHPSAQHVLAVLSFDLPPYTTVPAAKKTVNDALGRLRETGAVWQPQPRTWAITDPLFAPWVREHVPPWVLHQSARRSIVR